MKRVFITLPMPSKYQIRQGSTTFANLGDIAQILGADIEELWKFYHRHFQTLVPDHVFIIVDQWAYFVSETGSDIRSEGTQLFGSPQGFMRNLSEVFIDHDHVVKFMLGYYARQL